MRKQDFNQSLDGSVSIDRHLKLVLPLVRVEGNPAASKQISCDRTPITELNGNLEPQTKLEAVFVLSGYAD